MANLRKIKDLAQQRGVTLARIAEAANITPTGLSVILRENSTRVDTLEKIAECLGVPISTFFNDDPIPSSPGNTANVGSKFRGNLNVGSDQNISRALDILEGQLRAKDEQISGLIKALNK